MPRMRVDVRVIEHLQERRAPVIVSELRRAVVPLMDRKRFRAVIDVLVREGRLVRPHFGWVALAKGRS